MSLGIKGTQERNKKNFAPVPKKTQGAVSKKIEHLMSIEGTPQKQAVAMALNMNREGRLTPEGGYRRVKK